MDLTRIELTALRGLEALTRELRTRQAEELHRHAAETLEVWADIAVAHGLPADAFHGEWGIALDQGMIVRMDGTTPHEVTA